DLLAPLLRQLLEEALQRRLVPARRRPDQPAATVVHDHGQVPLPPPPADLVDPDPTQPGQPVLTLLQPSVDPGQDAAHAAPGDPHQLAHRRPRALPRQPGDRVVEAPREARAVVRPGHLGHHHAVTGAAHPGRARLQVGDRAPKIERPPPPTPVPGVIARAA